MNTVATEPPGLPEPENPALVAANLGVGVRLLVSGVAFVFMAFVFAFFYLKAVNSNGQWRPARVHPSQGYGIAILAGSLASALLLELGRRALPPVSAGRWRALAALALLVSIGVVVAFVLQLAGTHFGVTGGGYASVFYGWSVVSLAVWLGGVYWLETLVAGSLRAAGAHAATSNEGAQPLLPSAAACVVYLAGLSAIQVVAYVLLYLVK